MTLFLSLLFFVNSGNIASAETINNDAIQMDNTQDSIESAKEGSLLAEQNEETKTMNTFVSFIEFSDDTNENVYDKRGGFDKFKSIFKGEDSLESYVNDISYGKTKVN